MTRRHALDVVVPAPPATATTFPLLDSFRAIGALAVLTTHAAFWSGEYTRDGAWGTFLARLDVGVAIFFVLSGFLLTRPYLLRAAAGRPAPSTGRYLWKRALRILPVYAVAVVVALVFIHANRGLSNETRLSTALMLNTFTDPANPAGLSHMWSLAVEVTFYLCLPVIMLVAVGRSRTLALDAGARCARASSSRSACGGTSTAQPAPASTRRASRASGCRRTSAGSRSASGSRSPRCCTSGASARVSPLPSCSWGGSRAAAGCWWQDSCSMASTPLAGPTMLAAPTLAQSLTKNLMYGAVGGLIVVTGVFTRRDSSYSRWFGHGIARRLGWISYGIFALHLAVLHFVMWSTGWQLFEGRLPQIWVLTVVISIVVAEVVYRLVERPALSLKNLRPPWAPRSGRPGSTAPTPAPPSATPARGSAATGRCPPSRRRCPTASPRSRSPPTRHSAPARNGTASGARRVSHHVTGATTRPTATPGHPAMRPRPATTTPEPNAHRDAPVAQCGSWSRRGLRTTIAPTSTTRADQAHQAPDQAEPVGAVRGELHADLVGSRAGVEQPPLLPAVDHDRGQRLVVLGRGPAVGSRSPASRATALPSAGDKVRLVGPAGRTSRRRGRTVRLRIQDETGPACPEGTRVALVPRRRCHPAPRNSAGALRSESMQGSARTEAPRARSAGAAITCVRTRVPLTEIVGPVPQR